MSTSQDKTSSSQPAQAGVEPASVKAASASATAAAAPTAVTATQPGSQVAKCNDPDHAKIEKELMDLFYFSSAKNKKIEREWEAPDLPDKHDVHGFMDDIQDMHNWIAKICKLAKEANPELEMVENNPYESGEEDEE